MKRNKKGFTLIELIAVLVIMAILALIVTPLVMNIVKKAKDSANKRSVDAYGKAVELAVATYLLDNGDYPAEINSLTIEYSGNEVVCNVKTLNEDGSIYLSECSVKGTEVKDSSTEDGWYHYGKYASDVEAPGFSQEYKIGDLITYNGMDFYVIEDSDETSDRVTMLKAEPLTVDEVNTYGIDENGVNHVNVNTVYEPVGAAYDNNGYGGMHYYTSFSCGADENGNYVESDCKTDYELSEIKYVVDAWSSDKINTSDFKTDDLGYEARLITYEELINLGYQQMEGGNGLYTTDTDISSWVGNYPTWTMSFPANSNEVFYTNGGGVIAGVPSRYNSYVVRPVITLKKSAIAI